MFDDNTFSNTQRSYCSTFDVMRATDKTWCA